MLKRTGEIACALPDHRNHLRFVAIVVLVVVGEGGPFPLLLPRRIFEGTLPLPPWRDIGEDLLINEGSLILNHLLRGIGVQGGLVGVTRTGADQTAITALRVEEDQ